MSKLDLLLLARLFHIVASTLWAGAAILIAAFLMPAIRAAGPGGGAVMRQLTVVRKLPEILASVGIVAILSGCYLYWVASGGLQSAWIHSRTGSIYSLGAVAALIAAFIGIGINIPRAKRMGAIAASLHASGAQPTEEQSKILSGLALRIARGTRVVAVLLGIAAATMAVARYLP
jgi:uncharacterized membrane protein